MTNTSPIKLGLVGYGLGGRYFHAPFIEAAQGVHLAGIVTRNPERIAEAQADFPEVPIYASQTELLAAGVDAVVITTPPQTRRELVLEAIAAGVPTIADKPFAPDAPGGLDLAAAARDANVLLNVFHNRRWDTDIQTLNTVLAAGELGTIERFENRFDLNEPNTLDAGPTGGLLRDLGSHLVDQAIYLFGAPCRVYASLEWRDLPEGRTDAGFAIEVTHTSGVRSYLSSTKASYLSERELRVLGTTGSYVSRMLDVQAQAVFAGQRPSNALETWGIEAEERWGTLTTSQGQQKVASAQGAYQQYYEAFAAALRDGTAGPVPTSEAQHTLAVLDAARLSDAENRVIDL